jgi:hypothetical protein
MGLRVAAGGAMGPNMDKAPRFPCLGRALLAIGEVLFNFLLFLLGQSALEIL